MAFPKLNTSATYKIMYNELHHNEIVEKTTLLAFTEENATYDGEHPNGTDVYECFDDNNIRHLLYVCARSRRYCCLKRDDYDNNDYSINTNITRIYRCANRLHKPDILVFTNLFDHKFNLLAIKKKTLVI